MKNVLMKLQKVALSVLMTIGFVQAITNVNVACCAWSYQESPPEKLTRFKHLKDD